MKLFLWTLKNTLTTIVVIFALLCICIGGAMLISFILPNELHECIRSLIPAFLGLFCFVLSILWALQNIVKPWADHQWAIANDSGIWPPD